MSARRPIFAACLALWASLSSWLVATEATAQSRPYEVTEERSACRSFDPLKRPYFGDAHVHTAYSFDASTQDTRNTPRDAYRFASGEAIGIQPYDEEGRATRTIQLSRPLDWVAVTDHSEMLGDVNLCMTPGTEQYNDLLCRIHRDYPDLAFRLFAGRTLILQSHWGLCGDDDRECLSKAGKVWGKIQEAAEEAYDRSDECSFTSFVGYEWTATVEDGINLHRNVIFRNERVPDMPISWVETPTAVDLWNELQSQCVDAIETCDALTIPHNSNISAGMMFDSPRLRSSWNLGTPVSEEEARKRQRWEPLVEMMQHKGDSECRTGVGTTDELCNFEQLPYDRFGPKFSMLARRRAPRAPNFVREGLKRGLEQQARLGVNSLKYGVIASTDTHIAAPGLTAEKNHPGHGGAGLAAGEGVPVGFPDDFEFSPGGLAVVWSQENTRDALFTNMQRRETYGTSGTRPIVRFFGGWDYPDDLCSSPRFVAKGYAGGVPMGSDLPTRSGDTPRFAVWAAQDPGTAEDPGSPLQRIQIVKGWLADGELREKVVDVAGGENGASVDVDTCQRVGDGHANLCSVWSDPEFDPDAPAFYYARVVENPSCRWSQYVCLAAKVDCSDPGSVPDALEPCCAEDHQAAIQERAWSSPIWYTP